MFELNCEELIPGCDRVIRADTQAEVFRRAVQQLNRMGVERLTPLMLDNLRQRTAERPN